VSWQQYDPETTNRDESCAQLSGNSGLCFDQSRTLACIIKRNLQYLSVDMAIVIGQPRGKEEDELEACLGFMERMDHVEVSACPTSLTAWRLKASKCQNQMYYDSKLVHMSDSTLQELLPVNSHSLNLVLCCALCRSHGLARKTVIHYYPDRVTGATDYWTLNRGCGLRICKTAHRCSGIARAYKTLASFSSLSLSGSASAASEG
jgi:hypothetical protein